MRTNRRGQFLPISMMVMTTAVLFLGVAINVFRVAKAKLQAQNLADAAALAVAAMQSKSVNVVVDRNEWMNHIYAKSGVQDLNLTVHKNRIPPISRAHEWNPDSKDLVKEYARLVQTVNQTQKLFQNAYNNFIGAPAAAGTGGVPTQSQGANSLHDILSEIKGLSEPGVKIAVWNNASREQEAESRVDNLTDADLSKPASDKINVEASMDRVEYKTVPLRIKGKGENKTLKEILGADARGEEIGWLQLDMDKSPTLSARGVGSGGSQKVLGVGTRVAKRVRGLFGLPGTTVYAKSYAYIVAKSGQSGLTSGTPPKNFKPTYYVQLGNK